MIKRISMSAAWIALGLCLALPVGAAAQEMGQGEAHVTARSDVRMEIQSGPATTSGKLGQIGGLLGPVLSRVRDCYRDVLQERPTIQGQLKLRITMTGEARAEVETTLDEVEDETLVECVVEASADGGYEGIDPPGSAIITLHFTNTAAEGVEQMRSAQAAHRHEVTTNADGKPEASFTAPGGEVSYTVVGAGSTSADVVSSAAHDLRTHLAQMLDCRRRATRSHSDPNGELRYHLWIPARGRARTRQTRNTVEHAVGGRCMNTALTRAAWTPGSAGHVIVTIRFIDPPQPPAAEDEAPTEAETPTEAAPQQARAPEPAQE